MKQDNKLSTVLMAASALTNLGSDEEEQAGQQSDSGGSPSTVSADDQQLAQPAQKKVKTNASSQSHAPAPLLPIPTERHLPGHKKPNAALTFPEKLMHMMSYADEKCKEDPNYCVSWVNNGRAFMVRNPDEFTRDVVPLFFKQTKFSSFTRKLYRWGFRQMNRGAAAMDPPIFGNPNFHRDEKHRMANMRSMTARQNQIATNKANAKFFADAAASGGAYHPNFILPRMGMEGYGAGASPALNGGMPMNPGMLMPMNNMNMDMMQMNMNNMNSSPGMQQMNAGMKRKANDAPVLGPTNDPTNTPGWASMPPEQRIRILQDALDTSAMQLPSDGMSPAAPALGAAEPAPENAQAPPMDQHHNRVTIADRLRAAHSRASMTPPDQEQQQMNGGDQQLQQQLQLQQQQQQQQQGEASASPDMATYRAQLMQKTAGTVVDDSSPYMGGPVGLTQMLPAGMYAGAQPAPLADAPMAVGGGGGGTASSNYADVMNAAYDALHQSSHS